MKITAPTLLASDCSMYVIMLQLCTLVHPLK